jgi:hypothetical protein
LDNFNSSKGTRNGNHIRKRRIENQDLIENGENSNNRQDTGRNRWKKNSNQGIQIQALETKQAYIKKLNKSKKTSKQSKERFSK